MTIFFLPTVVFPDNLEGTIAAANSMMTLHREFPELQEETKNFKLLWNSTLAPYFLVTKKSLKVPIDLNGMKIGAGGIQGDFATINGGSGVAISPPKSYMSLKTGLLDGMALSWSALAVYKIWEVAPHLNTVDVGRVHLPVMMNADYWNSLPPDIQNLVKKLAIEQVTVGTKRLYKDTVKGRKRAIESGMQVYTPSGKEEPTWRAAFQKLEDQWLSDRLAEGHTVAPKLLERYKQIAAEANK
jgi:TRAP-type C4-dicarboxylate transport system substrate-binding protein